MRMRVRVRVRGDICGMRLLWSWIEECFVGYEG
jgi:hypothetical protein